MLCISLNNNESRASRYADYRAPRFELVPVTNTAEYLVTEHSNRHTPGRQPRPTIINSRFGAMPLGGKAYADGEYLCPTTRHGDRGSASAADPAAVAWSRGLGV